METIQFYFISNQYFIDFPDEKLMKNKSPVDGISGRPCFFAFKDSINPDIYWMIPITSRCDKYRHIYTKCINKYGLCDTLHFGHALGRECVFLIQNMFPATLYYLTPYYDENNRPVQIDRNLAEAVTTNAKSVLTKVNRGSKIVYPNILFIYHQLSVNLKDKR